ncbi:thiosulfate oxidation carrier protein SoxY [Bradyrhizobium sp. HKCCYLS20291]|uniref:thiosulfate oxidation carrier protein SoxY n=1 Tax=Bradyrhizobium sp. HKCCYLS20291 TaxID=3420766 RepID=UPI003EBF7A29
MIQLTRRGALNVSLGATAVALFGRIPVAIATPEETAQAISKFTSGATPKAGKVSLTVPEIAENGNTVPLSVSVESPMTKESHVKSVLIVADGNPLPGVATFYFSPMSGRADTATRIRLAQTQNVIAVAQMSDGTFYMDQKTVKVTIGGCGG